uniref:Ig-like domain-containing protein n=1 Tax=Xenopus tropicalis TaxID=8364 RepID=A0A803JU91_XENTR
MEVLSHDSLWGDSLEQPQSETGKQNEAQTITCTYTTSMSYPCLYWYRQYPNSNLQYILRKSSYCDNRAKGFERFNVVTDSSSTRLTINSLRPTDTAVYYCAIVDLHTDNIYCRL